MLCHLQQVVTSKYARNASRVKENGPGAGSAEFAVSFPILLTQFGDCLADVQSSFPHRITSQPARCNAALRSLYIAKLYALEFYSYAAGKRSKDSL